MRATAPEDLYTVAATAASPLRPLALSQAALPIPESELGAPRRRDRTYRVALLTADLAAAIFAGMAGLALGNHPSPSPLALAALPLVVLVAKAAGLYDRDENLIRKTTLDEIPAIFRVAPLCLLPFWLGDQLLVGGPLQPAQIAWIWALLLGSTVLARVAARRLVRALAPAERCLLIGDVESAPRVRSKLRDSSDLNARMIGRVPLGVEAPMPDVVGSLDSLGMVLAEHEVERVLIAPDGSEPELILHAIRIVRSMGVKVSVLPRLFEAVGSAVEIDDLGGLPLLGLRGQGLPLSSRLLKRGADVVVSFASLLLLAPVLVAVAVAIKRDSPGPVLFRQRRVGRHGKEFEILKFRTMHDGADAMKTALMRLNEGADGFFKIAEDPRVTMVGRLLRRTCLDELPQLLNVLRGEMSLVGPRPLVVDEDRRINGWERTRLDLVPGITGFWQVLGSSRVPLDEMVKIDYLYATSWSLWLDVKLVLRTVPHVLARRGL